MTERQFRGTAEHYAAHRIPYPRALFGHLLRLVPGRQRLLDLACGTGELAIPLSERFGEVVAVDLEPDMVAAGMRKAPGLTWIVAAAEELLFEPGTLDLVTVGNAFHRLDRALVAARARTWLKPGGAIAVVNTDSVWRGTEPWQRTAVEIVAKWRPQVAPAKRASHEKVLRSAGFADVEERLFHVPHVWSVDGFIGYLYSTSVVSKAALGANAGAFERELRAALTGTLRETARFSCLTGYCR
ncbi:class I SAM-dependent methyltransferase [Allorhizocola rhizosphaerae]|uniref:class I SAM-dependent methyltransferase n=1 Tax=Allorhizocola rhizosphaerae TaxID=1872709 RepID=UPI0013C2BEF1|nr:class I SAM-dependent methyltransferase [Allorhizocola rhizosphaerae]